MESKKYIVYVHICPNNKKYVGQTCQNPIDRWNFGKGYIKNKEFYTDIQKFGWENIEHIILRRNLSSQGADDCEKYWIKKYNSNNPKKGYNKTIGGKEKLTKKEKHKIEMEKEKMRENYILSKFYYKNGVTYRKRK